LAVALLEYSLTNAKDPFFFPLYLREEMSDKLARFLAAYQEPS
jgi:hypothetical protein